MHADSEVIIVGSGPAGAMAALALRGRGVRLLDFGHTPANVPRLHQNLYELRRTQDITSHVINLRPSPPVSLKLRAPALEFVIRDWQQFAPLASSTFRPVISLAKGGFANAWGAGVYRFHDGDLHGYPISASDLTPHYDVVAAHIGISGDRDDLWDEFGPEPSLDPPMRLSHNCEQILAAYQRRRPQGVRIGRPRLAVITQPRPNREPYAYRALEFIQTGDPAMYNPARTIDDLANGGAITYEPGHLVQKFHETTNGVEVITRSASGTTTFRARTLILAAGALNTARIVLASNNDHTTRLPLLDNPMTVVPIFHPSSYGRTLNPHDSAMAQLNMVLSADTFGAKYQASLYGCNGAPMSEFISLLPFSLDLNRRLLRYLIPALSLSILFHPAEPGPTQYLRLREDGALEAVYEWRPDATIAARLCAVFRQFGLFTAPFLAKHSSPGEGIHYAGPLPMSDSPQRYQLHKDGRLEGTRRVYVCDGACFPRLPAKNHTYTIMANAHRIASGLKP